MTPPSAAQRTIILRYITGKFVFFLKQMAGCTVIKEQNFLAMITKKELLEGLELLYTGKAFAGFQEENPFVTFLRFDKKNWSKIWVKYGGRAIITKLKDVRLKSEGNLAV